MGLGGRIEEAVVVVGGALGGGGGHRDVGVGIWGASLCVRLDPWSFWRLARLTDRQKGYLR